MQGWNPYWLAYMRTQGFSSPKKFMKCEEQAHPGGRMAGFILWIADRKRAFAAEHPDGMFDCWNIGDHELWARFITGG